MLSFCNGLDDNVEVVLQGCTVRVNKVDKKFVHFKNFQINFVVIYYKYPSLYVVG